MSTLFINGKQVVIDGLRKFKNRPSWLVIFLVVPYDKIPLFSKEFVTFITSFTSLLVRAIPEPVIDEISFIFFNK